MIWEALDEPYRLSVCYEVSIARIDSQRVTGAGRVGEQSSAYRSKGIGDIGDES